MRPLLDPLDMHLDLQANQPAHAVARTVHSQGSVS